MSRGRVRRAGMIRGAPARTLRGTAEATVARSPPAVERLDVEKLRHDSTERVLGSLSAVGPTT